MRLPVQSVTVTEITRKHELRLTGAQLIEALNLVGEGSPIPPRATVAIGVPGGGDWSNTDLDVDDQCPLVISWTETEVQHDG